MRIVEGIRTACGRLRRIGFILALAATREQLAKYARLMKQAGVTIE